MSEGALISIVAMVGWLILAGSALASYRLSWGKTVKIALTWLAIFVGLFLVLRFFGL